MLEKIAGYNSEICTLIGNLDFIISKLMIYAKNKDTLGESNLQTVKHHAEDMIAAGSEILSTLKGENQKRDLPLTSTYLEQTYKYEVMSHTNHWNNDMNRYFVGTTETGFMVHVYMERSTDHFYHVYIDGVKVRMLQTEGDLAMFIEGCHIQEKVKS